MVTTLEVIDTAVKVGLGALLTVIGGYMNARLQHSQGVAKDVTARRRAALEEINLKYARHRTAIRRCGLVLFPYWRDGTGESAVRDAAAALFAASDELAEAIASAELLGETEIAERLLAHWRKSTPLVYLAQNPDRPDGANQWKEVSAELAPDRKAVSDSLSSAYTKLLMAR
jgi:hypothetical protein